MTNQPNPYQPGIDPSHPRHDERYQMAQPYQPQRRKTGKAQQFFVVFGGVVGIVLGIAGLEWADYHEPSLANALAGRQLYSDAGTIRSLSIIIILVSIGLLVWTFARGRKH